MKKTFLYTITLFAFYTLTSCENNLEEVNSITAEIQKKLPVQTSKNAEYIYSDSAVVRAKLIAPQIDNYGGKKPYMELPLGMNVVFFQQDKKEQTKLTANYGIGYDNGNGVIEKMEAKGNVIVINEKGEKLNTEHLIWNAFTKKIYTDAFVKITTKDQVIVGDGMEADQDFSSYEIKNVKGTFDIKDADLAPDGEEK